MDTPVLLPDSHPNSNHIVNHTLATLIRDTEHTERISFLPDPASGGVGQKNAARRRHARRDYGAPVLRPAYGGTKEDGSATLRASLVPLTAGLRIFICQRPAPQDCGATGK